MVLSEQFFHLITIEDTLCVYAVVIRCVNLAWTDACASILTNVLCIGMFVPVNVLFADGNIVSLKGCVRGRTENGRGPFVFVHFLELFQSFDGFLYAALIFQEFDICVIS